VNLARAENHEGAMKKWLKHLNSTPFGFMPAGPRLAATGGRVAGLFFPTQSTIGIAAVQTAIEYDETRCDEQPFF
jgi:hypothetical protein